MGIQQDLAKEQKRWKIENQDDRSRYSRLDRILYQNNVSQIETSNPVSISQDNSDKFYRVEAGFENRLDLISWKYYSTPLYWWVIAYASNISDPFDVGVGTLLRIPSLQRALGEITK